MSQRPNSYTWKFIQEIIKRSPGASSFEEALLQWEVISIMKSNKPEDCLCSYKNIVNLNFVRNKITDEYIIVGSCCVEKFGVIYPDKYRIKCHECKKVLPITNDYVQSLFDNHVVIDNTVRVLGHDKCAKRIKYAYDELVHLASSEPPTGNIRHSTYFKIKDFVKYFNGIVVRADIINNKLLIRIKADYEDYFALLGITEIISV